MNTYFSKQYFSQGNAREVNSQGKKPIVHKEAVCLFVYISILYTISNLRVKIPTLIQQVIDSGRYVSITGWGSAIHCSHYVKTSFAFGVVYTLSVVLLQFLLKMLHMIVGETSRFHLFLNYDTNTILKLCDYFYCLWL